MLGIAANAIVNAPHIKEYASGLFERGANLFDFLLFHVGAAALYPNNRFVRDLSTSSAAWRTVRR